MSERMVKEEFHFTRKQADSFKRRRNKQKQDTCEVLEDGDVPDVVIEGVHGIMTDGERKSQLCPHSRPHSQMNRQNREYSNEQTEWAVLK